MSDVSWQHILVTVQQAVVTSDEAEAMAKRLGLRFYRACVKENLNVSEGLISSRCNPLPFFLLFLRSLHCPYSCEHLMIYQVPNSEGTT